MRYKLVLDFGNTLKKVAVFHGDRLLELRATTEAVIQEIEELKGKYKAIDAAILSTVVKVDVHLLAYMKANFNFFMFNEKTPIPIKNEYQSPQTLGKDRLAAAVGAYLKFPNENVLVIDAGSSITYEFISEKAAYLGGAISPGIQLRAKALHQFTDQLPLVKAEKTVELLGSNTLDCIQSGIVNGAQAEVNAMTQSFVNQFEDLKIILTGGDAIYFEKSLKYNIFASENLVLEGLNHILDFNEL